MISLELVVFCSRRVSSGSGVLCVVEQIASKLLHFIFGFVELILTGVDGVDGVGEKEPGEGKPRHYILLEILVVPEMWWLVIMHFPLQLKADLGWLGLAS